MITNLKNEKRLNFFEWKLQKPDELTIGSNELTSRFFPLQVYVLFRKFQNLTLGVNALGIKPLSLLSEKSNYVQQTHKDQRPVGTRPNRPGSN
ncbi:MAG: hypothetical protein J7527_16400, partial [Chitinophagaceae bacterium]|nr:hypothetical protein [Chitinophagaceae bacterium]